MKKVIISPFSSRMPENRPNPKNYPYWKEVVSGLQEAGIHITQIGIEGEQKLDGVDEILFDKSYAELKEICKQCDTWIAVDNFFQHFMMAETNISGIVIWSLSDPELFGYRGNINLLKNRSYLRTDQYNVWFNVIYNQEAFVSPDIVIGAVLEKLKDDS